MWECLTFQTLTYLGQCPNLNRSSRKICSFLDLKICPIYSSQCPYCPIIYLSMASVCPVSIFTSRLSTSLICCCLLLSSICWSFTYWYVVMSLSPSNWSFSEEKSFCLSCKRTQRCHIVHYLNLTMVFPELCCKVVNDKVIS